MSDIRKSAAALVQQALAEQNTTVTKAVYQQLVAQTIRILDTQELDTGHSVDLLENKGIEVGDSSAGGVSVDILNGFKVDGFQYGPDDIRDVPSNHFYVKFPAKADRNCNQGQLEFTSKRQVRTTSWMPTGFVNYWPENYNYGAYIYPNAYYDLANDGYEYWSERYTMGGFHGLTTDGSSIPLTVKGVEDGPFPGVPEEFRGLSLHPGTHRVKIKVYGRDITDITQAVYIEQTYVVTVADDGTATCGSPINQGAADTLDGAGATVTLAPRAYPNADANNVDITVTGQAGVSLAWTTEVEVTSEITSEIAFVKE